MQGIDSPESIGSMFMLIAHCGGERRTAIFTPVGNTQEIFERAIKEGAGGMEADLAQTRDGVLVMAHPSLFPNNKLNVTAQEYLNGRDGRLAFEGFCEWLSKQDTRFFVLLEVKGSIDPYEFIRILRIYDSDEAKLLDRIHIYSLNNNLILQMLGLKREWQLRTSQLPLAYTTNLPLTKKLIDKVKGYGDDDCGIAFVVHAVLFGQRAVSTTGFIRRRLTSWFIGNWEGLKEVVGYAHKKGLKVMFGTVDKYFIPQLIVADVDGAMCDDFSYFQKIGVALSSEEYL